VTLVGETLSAGRLAVGLPWAMRRREPAVHHDVRDVIAEVVDDGYYLELHATWARNAVCALSRLGGQVVDIVANQPSVLAGVLDIDAAEKSARFVRTCTPSPSRW
jgi:methylmalonyl-CoA decarboxylase subunit alpha